MILHGDCLEILKTLDANSVDSLVTDPPAGISFMGKSWDSDKGGRGAWVKWMSDVMSECLRVMKPGAHGLVWSLPRTSHWTALALESAGFEIRDCVYHIFGSGFPKSLDVSKAIDKAAGAEREVISECGSDGVKRKPRSMNPGGGDVRASQCVTAPATDSAKQWQGWGTALKPAVECWWLIRKPCSEKTVAANVLKWGTGALNIDASRVIGTERPARGNRTISSDSMLGANSGMATGTTTQGRFPSHLILDEEAGAMLDEQSLAGGMHSAGVARKGSNNPRVSQYNASSYHLPKDTGTMYRFGDSGGASRFFYCAKISSSERNAGLEGMPKKAGMEKTFQNMSDPRLDRPQIRNENQNNHPTVKPQKLMRYLCRMVTPPSGLVLDPFMGSGSTGLAAISEGFRFTGIEREEEYVRIAEKRMEATCDL